MNSILVETMLGRLRLTAEEGAVARLDWDVGGESSGGAEQGATPLLLEAKRQLLAYFDGRLQAFDLPLAPAGTAFQRAVYAAMSAIPFGETRTYGQLAAQLNTAARPVGTACGANPIPIIIPCHRVLSKTGPGGYSGAGGLNTKSRLLRLEAADAQPG